MLGSITPLGERGRGTRWGITILWFTLGAVAAGTGLGSVLGLAGHLASLRSTAWRHASLGILAILALAGAALDGGALGLRLPRIRRQVNEEWLGRYRGWVYGVGFGFQLGLGLVTVASVSAVYLTFAAAFLSAGAQWGGLIGGAFGLMRAATLFPAGAVRRTPQLVSMDARLRRWDGPTRRLAVAAEVALAAVALTAAIA